jgi:hypothetical protein
MERLRRGGADVELPHRSTLPGLVQAIRGPFSR